MCREYNVQITTDQEVQKIIVRNKLVTGVQTQNKTYNCDFWDCLVKDEAPFFLVSKKAHDYWLEKFYFALVASLILLAITFFLVENKLNWPIYAGSILILSTIPLLKIESLLGSFPALHSE